MKEEAFSVIQGLNSCWQQAVPDGPLSSWPAVPCCSWRAEVRGPAAERGVRAQGPGHVLL